MALLLETKRAKFGAAGAALTVSERVARVIGRPYARRSRRGAKCRRERQPGKAVGPPREPGHASGDTSRDPPRRPWSAALRCPIRGPTHAPEGPVPGRSGRVVDRLGLGPRRSPTGGPGGCEMSPGEATRGRPRQPGRMPKVLATEATTGRSVGRSCRPPTGRSGCPDRGPEPSRRRLGRASLDPRADDSPAAVAADRRAAGGSPNRRFQLPVRGSIPGWILVGLSRRISRLTLNTDRSGGSVSRSRPGRARESRARR
jgi:hypothetical protein